MERRPTRILTILAVSLLALTLIAPWVLGQDPDPITEIRRQAGQGDVDAQFRLGYIITPPCRGVAKVPQPRRIATMTCATGFCNAIRVLILRREPSPLPVAEPTGFTTVALTALACKIAPICLIPSHNDAGTC